MIRGQGYYLPLSPSNVADSVSRCGTGMRFRIIREAFKIETKKSVKFFTLWVLFLFDLRVFHVSSEKFS